MEKCDTAVCLRYIIFKQYLSAIVRSSRFVLPMDKYLRKYVLCIEVAFAGIRALSWVEGTFIIRKPAGRVDFSLECLSSGI